LLLILEEYWVPRDLLELVVVALGQQEVDRARVKAQVSDRILDVEVDEDLEESQLRGLLLDEPRNVTRVPAGVYRLKHEELAQCRIVDADLVEILKVHFAVLAHLVLLLDADLTVVVIAPLKVQHVPTLYLQVIDLG
jgi:hypothetical protein